jgi:5-formyltetrahydrofolate cyclo-ligase
MLDPFKMTLRNSIKQIRSKLPIAYRTINSETVCNRIKKLGAYRYAKRIALYHATNGEVDLNSIWNSAPLQGKYCYFPALTEENTLVFLPATPATPFKNNKYGVLEPDVSHNLSISLDELDIVLIPLVAFDAQCRRLGMGAGYYDRTLSNKPKALLLGIAYEFQRVDFIESQSWDVPMDKIITQKNTYIREA